MFLRYLLGLLGVFLAMPVVVLIVLAFAVPITLSGIGYLLASSLVIAGLIIALWADKYSFLLIGIGVIGIAFVAGARLVLATREGDSNLRVITLPQGTETRWINHLIDEQDSLIFGEAIFHLIGGDSPREHEGLTDTLHKIYTEMRSMHPVFASPFLSTYLNLQRSRSFDAVIIEPETVRHPEVAIVFLHGHMGNVTAQCWEIAQAVGKFGATTVCPSTDWTGQWWQPEGKRFYKPHFDISGNKE